MRCGPELLDELEFPSRAPWHRMGLHRVDEAAWMPPVGDRNSTVRAKRRLLGWVPADVVVVGDVSAGVLDRVVEVLSPFASDPGVCSDRPGPDPSDGSVASDAAGADSVRRFATTAAELIDDVCVLERRGGVPVMTAGAVFFPSHWSLRAKIDGSVRMIHAPVPDDGSDMAGKAQRFMARMDPGRIWVRTNWFVHDRPVRFAPRSPRTDRVVEPGSPSPHDPPRLWVRSERQTLRALDDEVTLFTIRTRFAPIAVFRERPDAAAALVDLLSAMPATLIAEKVRPAHVPPLRSYLENLHP